MDGGDKFVVCILTLATIVYIASKWIEHDAELAQLRLAVQMYQSQLEGK